MDECDEQIEAGKYIVTGYIQKERPDYAGRVNALDWVQSPEDKKEGHWRLAFYAGSKRYTIVFREVDLEDAPGTPEVERKIKRMIDEFFRSLPK